MRNLNINVFLHNNPTQVGELMQVDHNIYFEYSSEFIETGFSLSPFKLPLEPGVQVDKQKVFSGLHGVFNDSLPDGWGLLIMDRYFKKQGIERHKIAPLQRLAFINDRGLGALTYEPSIPLNLDWSSTMSLEFLARDCESILEGAETDILPELIIAGGSPGGARPKVLIGFNQTTQQICAGTNDLPVDFQHYLVKFSEMLDINDIAELEFAYAKMAKDCDINMPATRLFNAGKYGMAFGVERFDRIFNQRVHYHTLSGLLHADFREPNLDYLDFLKATWLLTQDIEQMIQAYRRMVFNVLMHNRDDHSKNFGYLYNNNEWALSPAYDLTYSTGMAGEHTMTINGEGLRPTQKDLLAVAESVNIPKNRAKEIIDQIVSVRENWARYAEQANVKKNLIKQIKHVFEHTVKLT